LDKLILSMRGLVGKPQFPFRDDYFKSVVPPSLTSLVIRADVWYKGLVTPDHVLQMSRRMPRLTHLEICDDSTIGAGKFDFSGMRKLTSLRLMGWGGDLYSLILPPGLTSLQCGREVSDFDVDVLPPSITAVECYKWQVSREVALKTVPNLVHLEMTDKFIVLAHLPLTLTSVRVDVTGRRDLNDGSLFTPSPDWPPLLTDLETNRTMPATLVLPKTLRYARVELNLETKQCFTSFFGAPVAATLVKANLHVSRAPPGYESFVRSLKGMVSLEELSLQIRTMELESVLKSGSVSLPCCRSLKRLAVSYSPVSTAFEGLPLDVDFVVPTDGSAASLEKVSIGFLGVGSRAKTFSLQSLFSPESMNVNHLIVSVRCYDSVIYLKTGMPEIIADLGHCTIDSWISRIGPDAGSRRVRLLNCYPFGINVFKPAPDVFGMPYAW
jgi:hypothetical protein